MKHYKKFFTLILAGLLLLGLTACEGGSIGDGLYSSTRPEPSTIEIRTDKEDPYSYTIKELYEIYASASVDMNHDYLEDQYYALHDIDDNGTKELLIGSEEYSGIVLQAVHAIQNGVAVWQEALPSLVADFPEQRSILKNGTIRVKSVVADEGSFFRYYRFEDGELKLQIILLDSAFGIEYYRREYGNNDVPITNEEFDRVQKEMEGDGQVVELDWKPLAEYGR